MKSILLLILSIIMQIMAIAQMDDRLYLLHERLPSWSLDALKAAKTFDQYQISDYINPFYLEGDFNGDAKLDIAILVEELKSKKKGILIFHNTEKTPVILGAGTEFGQGGGDFGWMDVWKVFREDRMTPGLTETKTIFLTGASLWVAKSESASGLIYHTSKGYKWSQQSD